MHKHTLHNEQLTLVHADCLLYLKELDLSWPIHLAFLSNEMKQVSAAMHSSIVVRVAFLSIVVKLAIILMVILCLCMQQQKNQTVRHFGKP